MAITQAEVDAAVKTIIESGAASYSIGQRSVSKLDPKMLYDLAKQIEFDQNRAAYGAFRVAKIGKTSQ